MRNRTYHHGDLENALVDQALHLARRGGTAAVGVRAVARAVGVSHAAAYRHFRGRRSLLAAVASEAMNDLAGTLEGVPKDSAPVERLAGLARAYVTWARRNPGAFRVAFSEELWDKTALPRLRAASDRASWPVLEATADVLRSVGRVEDHARLAVAVWSQVHGFSVLALDRQLSQGGLSRSQPESEGLPDDAERAVRALVAGWLMVEGGA